MAFNQRITRIKGLSEKRRLPRLGKIRLGIKKKSAKSGIEYPAEVPYFVVPDEVKKAYGDKPNEIDVMLPLDDLDVVFPVSYKFYGSGKGLKCNGDGEIAYRVNEQTKEMEEIKCPCENLENGKCKQSGTLSVMLQKINVGGVYQITTSSFNSIVDLASGIDYVKALIGRVAMVPLKLRRVATETHHEEKKQTHHTLQLILDANIDAINQLRSDTIRVLEHTSRIALPEPLNENPELDPVDIILDEEEPQSPEDQPAASEAPLTGVITPAQGKRLFAISNKSGISIDDLKLYLMHFYGYQHSNEILKSKYEEIIATVSSKEKFDTLMKSVKAAA